MTEVTLELMNDDGTVWKTLEHVPFTYPDVECTGPASWISTAVNSEPVCFSAGESHVAPKVMRLKVGELLIAATDDVTWTDDEGGAVGWLNPGNVAVLKPGQIILELKA